MTIQNDCAFNLWFNTINYNLKITLFINLSKNNMEKVKEVKVVLLGDAGKSQDKFSLFD